MNCAFPGCEQLATQPHHVTYKPSVVKHLCTKHHEEITRINAHAARKYRVTLSNPFRWHLWYKFIHGETKRPRITRLDREWQEQL
jgi:hypothetical protein